MEVLRTAILDMLRRKKGESFTSSEIIQQMFPEDWEQFLEEVNTEAIDLHHEGLISVETIESSGLPGPSKIGYLIISSPNKLK